MAFISVIVPAFNAEKTLQTTVKDILAQTYRDFEIILVNDGSSDNTAELCNQLCHQYPIIRVIHQENKGPSSARNNGTKQAMGKYVTYIDSDDRIDQRYLEYLVRAILKDGADQSCGKIDRMKENCEPLRITEEYIAEFFDTKETLSEMLTGKKLSVGPWCRLVPKQWQLQNPFLDGAYYEDLSNTYKINMLSKRTAYIDRPLYHYVMRGGSITGRKETTVQQCIDYYNAINLCSTDVLRKFPDLDKDVAVLASRDNMSLYLSIHRCPNKNIKLDEIEKDVLLWMKDHWKDAFKNIKAPTNVRLRSALFGISPKLYEKIYYIGIKIKGKAIR